MENDSAGGHFEETKLFVPVTERSDTDSGFVANYNLNIMPANTNSSTCTANPNPEQEVTPKTSHITAEDTAMNSSLDESSQDMQVEDAKVKLEATELSLSVSESDSDIQGLANVNRLSCRKRKVYPLTEKYVAVQRIKNGESRPKVCKEMGLAESTLRGWIKGAESLKEALQISDDQFITAEDWDQLDTALYTWFLNEHQAGNKISGHLLKTEAEKLYRYFNPTKSAFKTLRNFIQKFKQRHNIIAVCLQCGQSDNALLIPKCEPIVDCSGDVDGFYLSTGTDSGVEKQNDATSNTKINLDASDHDASTSFSGGSDYARPADTAHPSQCQEEITNSFELASCSSEVKKVSSRKIVFYLEESLKWLKSKPSCICSCNSASEVERLIQLAKTEACFEGQKRITDFFS